LKQINEPNDNYLHETATFQIITFFVNWNGNIYDQMITFQMK